MKTLEDAGYGGECIKGSKTGVYVGLTPNFLNYNYKDLISKTPHKNDSLIVQTNLPAIIPSRVSYFLDLKGPSMYIDTACSSVLVAVHMACQAIHGGECEQAIVGGIKLNLFPVILKTKLGIESATGYCRPFDDEADGAAIGEGVGSVFLKPLYRAIEDRDHVYAVIKGSAINQDGKSMGITAPNALAQKEIIIKAWEDAGINPETIDYIEAHGTGTRIGDPIEFEGIHKAFSHYTSKKQFCALASVKGNVGHLYEGSGIASLIKAVLALNYKEIPPSINFKIPNREIDFEKSALFMNTELLPWKKNNHNRRCGISSYGISGTNCHLILEEAVITPSTIIKPCEPEKIFCLSTLSEKSLLDLVSNYIDYFTNHGLPVCEDICFTANSGRGHYTHRLCFIIRDKDELAAALTFVLKNGLRTDEEKKIYFGYHKIAPLSKDVLAKDEISEDERSRLTEKMKVLVTKNKQQYSLDELKKIAGFYVSGASVDWKNFYNNKDFHRIPLPVYPFEKIRCWIDIPGSLQDKVKKDIHYEITYIEKEINIDSAGLHGHVLLLRDENDRKADIRHRR
jgi:acyl transferase domain-containing protein